MKNYFVNMFLAILLAVVSCNGKKDSKELAEDQNDGMSNPDLKKDSEFAVDATDAGLFEVQVANLARTKAYSARVKEFAEMMIRDHTKANTELRDLAGGKGMALPDVICEDCQRKYYDLDQKTTGEEFDEQYMELMVKEHKDVIDKFEKQADNGNDPEITAWAAGKLPALRHHLQEAENIQKSVKEARNN